jgi:hypothetical protein
MQTESKEDKAQRKRWREEYLKNNLEEE